MTTFGKNGITAGSYTVLVYVLVPANVASTMEQSGLLVVVLRSGSGVWMVIESSR